MEDRDPVCLNAKNASGTSLQVHFSRRQDRHVHTISVVIDGRQIPVFESVEGTSVDVWPPSPPLQQLSIEELRPETRVAFLVGMAGKGHWSMSVEPAQGRAAFVFDVACRAGAAVGQLGSSYSLLADGLSGSGDDDVAIDVEGETLQLTCDHDAKTASILRSDTLGIRIEPAVTDSCGTTRWRYTIELL